MWRRKWKKFNFRLDQNKALVHISCSANWRVDLSGPSSFASSGRMAAGCGDSAITPKAGSVCSLDTLAKHELDPSPSLGVSVDNLPWCSYNFGSWHFCWFCLSRVVLGRTQRNGDVTIATIMPLSRSEISWVLFRWQKICLKSVVALSFVFGNYCPIMV
jgi:hypothetical protein